MLPFTGEKRLLSLMLYHRLKLRMSRLCSRLLFHIGLGASSDGNAAGFGTCGFYARAGSERLGLMDVRDLIVRSFVQISLYMAVSCTPDLARQMPSNLHAQVAERAGARNFRAPVRLNLDGGFHKHGAPNRSQYTVILIMRTPKAAAHFWNP